MRNSNIISILGVTTALALTACATVPDKSELERLDGSAVESALVENTVTSTADYGRWAEYHKADGTGRAKAWGNWGSQGADSSYEIGDDGEVCWTYSGPHDWSSPEHEYCSLVYLDVDGNYYMETTKDTWKPHREGNLKKVEVKTGDAYKLFQ